MKLINSQTKQELRLGDMVETFRGELCKIMDYAAPTHAGSTGRVTVQIHNQIREFFPSVINAEIVD